MKYETPEVKTLLLAIDAIQATLGTKGSEYPISESPFMNDSGGAYQDWE